MSETPHTEAFFLPFERGKRFCVLYRPQANSRGAVLYAPPFAEEMNRTRRIAALASRALAWSGWTVLQMDLFGCGDSDGEFEDARWDIWVADLAVAAGWLRNDGAESVTLWGVRAGAMLACDAVPAIENCVRLLMWNPVASGAQHLRQFLRIDAAAAALHRRSSGESRAGRRLDRRTSVEVAGYQISPELANGMNAARLQPPANASKLMLIEVGGTQGMDEHSLRPWHATGWNVCTEKVRGPTFWQSQGTTEASALVDATVGMLSDAAK